MTRICCCSHSAQHTAHTVRAMSSPRAPGRTRPAPSRVWPQRIQVTFSGTETAETAQRRIAERCAAEHIREWDRTEDAAVGGVVLPVSHDQAAVGCRLRHALQQQTRALARIAHQHDVTRTRASLREHEDPVPLPQRRLHAVAAHGHAPRSHLYFFVAQKMSLISLTAAWRSAAACASTFCLFFDASFSAFQNVSCSFGYFSTCSGLK